jgi:hypothetical protein
MNFQTGTLPNFFDRAMVDELGFTGARSYLPVRRCPGDVSDTDLSGVIVVAILLPVMRGTVAVPALAYPWFGSTGATS